MIAVLDLHMAAIACAVLLILIAVRSLFVDEDKRPLGCGFALAAAVVVAYLIRDSIGGFGNGLRLTLAGIMLVPAQRALSRTRRGSTPFAVVGIILAIAVGAEPAQRLFYAYGPASARSEISVARMELESMRTHRVQVEQRLNKIVLQREGLTRDLRALSVPDSVLIENPKAAQLAKVLHAKEQYEAALVVIDDEVLRLQQRVSDLEAGLELHAFKKDNPELGAVLEELKEPARDLDRMNLIDRTMRKAELESMLEKELR